MDMVTLFTLCALGVSGPACGRPDHPSERPILVAALEANASPDSAAAPSDSLNRPSAVDQWRPYIVEASRRFGMLEQWVRAVMRAESGGHTMLDGRPITSSAGAMGLMQVMPGTYAAMRLRLGLGGDPYEPRDNIFAGAAYLRDMYDRYGYPGLFAAYNAGPDRFDAYLLQGRTLPDETWGYLAAIGPDVQEIVRAQGSAGGPLATPRTSSSASARTVVPSGTMLFFKLGAGITTPLQASTGEHPDPRAGLLFVPLGRGADAVRHAGEGHE
jgi:membrane-bound lytic murein transglycosylase B